MNQLQQASFDIYAASYDDHFTGSAIGIAQRKVVHQYLSKWIPGNGNILEINCGTGEDALFLLETCNSITCSDVSEGMIGETKRKTKHHANITTIVSPMQEIHQKLDKQFDLVFSNFGGLNCLSETEFTEFLQSLTKLTKAGTDVVFVIMGRKCLWEQFYFLIKGDSKKAFRRKKRGGIIANLRSADQLTFYYSPKEVKKMALDVFDVKRIRPVGFFIPPSYLNPFFKRGRILLSVLITFEKLISSFGFFANSADHYLIHLKRK